MYKASCLGGKFLTIPIASLKSDMSLGINGSWRRIIFSLLAMEAITKTDPVTAAEKTALLNTINIIKAEIIIGSVFKIMSSGLKKPNVFILLKAPGADTIANAETIRQNMKRNTKDGITGISIRFDFTKSNNFFIFYLPYFKNKLINFHNFITEMLNSKGFFKTLAISTKALIMNLLLTYYDLRAVTVVLTYVIEILLLLIGLMFLNLSSKNVERLKVEYNNIPELKNPSFNSYKKGKYHYTEVLFQYNDNDNICYLTLTLTDEYRLNRKTTQKEQAKKYYTDLTKKDINIKAFQNKNGVKLNHYYSEDYNTDYYFYSSKNMTSILKFEISKDDGKCSQLKDNVIDNTVIIKGN